MLQEVQTLWRQLNGPQAVAYVRSIFKYFKDTYDANLDYLNELSIATANETHLNFIGTLMGIKRPIVQNEIKYNKLLSFSNTLLSDNSQGFSTDYTNEDDQGGFFDSADRTITEDATGLLDLEDYRFVLQVLSEQEGSFRSLQLIDRIIARFILAPVSYALSYHPTIPGDIVVTLSNSTAYRALLMKILLNMFFLTAPTVHVLVEGQAA
jgi:hypothetical protein